MQSPATLPGRARLPLRLVEAMLDESLAAFKTGTLEPLLRRRPHLTRWFVRCYLGPVLGAAGDSLHGERRLADATGLWLRWLVSRLRPDHLPELSAIDREAWIHRTGWRPMLAVMCHYGFAPVPDFRDRYHRRAEESAADNLCGLWSVVPSTFYRYLDKGKRLLAEWVCEQRPSGPQQLELRALVQQDVHERLRLSGDAERAAWHRAQALSGGVERDSASTLWHWLQAGDAAAFIHVLRRDSIALAGETETDALIEALERLNLTPRQRFDLCLAQAALWRTRHAEDMESRSYEQALRIASAGPDKLLLGIVYAAMGRFHETRDPDRSFACYEDSVQFLREAALGDGAACEPEVVEAHISTLVKLAWLYLLRNDPRARTVLDRAESMRQQRGVSEEALALLEQTWGEYWRRAGDLQRAAQHKHRALNLYERLGDQTAVLKTYSNLGLIYGDAKDFTRAIEYSRKVLDLAARMNVEPEIVANTHLNLGVAYFWQADYTQAIAEYQQALQRSIRASLKLGVWRANYNLAEAYYFRFKETQASDDERLGDMHAQAALALGMGYSDPATDEATRKLKVDILGPTADRAHDRLLPPEAAAHFNEMAEVQRQRAALAVPAAPQDHVRAHLAIANAYLAIAAKEREAARALIDRHALGDRFAGDFEQLRSTFDRELTREQKVATLWRQATGDLLSEERRTAVLSRLLHGEPITKSSYAELCAVGPATASKHLGVLAERGLLLQTGKGPSTRYVLPQ
ncbi:tetratricopeptide repeat protein [Ideonella sp. BN130291]|uniref:tetratricopeptide repeat protein n=1 Tax=Ideonella sp. BN130291 TaxID=3112940 RepID=UPI002E25C4A2|nr:tetratricopeptide repeat protein [Ideonella sp. BN130291]